MAQQASLFGEMQTPKRRMSLRERFRVWLESPDGQVCLREATARALRLKARGFSFYSMDAIFHSIRYDMAIKVGPDNEGWKINNNHTSFMAREIMLRRPELSGFFETRVQKA